jgi:diacylglycerol kinase (ATP)
MEATKIAPLVILNPAANRGHMQPYRSLVQQRTQQEHAHYVETHKQGDARKMAAEAAAQGRPIVIVGGDGSVNEVVNGILDTGCRVPLGIVPAGSGNDFAYRTLGLPRDIAQTIEIAFAGRLKAIDAGRVNETFFANSFSIGLDANIAFATRKLRKLPLMSGARLYYTATLQEILFGYQRCPWLRLALDDRVDMAGERRYILIATTIGPSYGAGFYINPQADPCDGLFDICAIDFLPLLRLLKLFPGVKQGKHIEEPEVTIYRARSLHLESREPVIAQIDGETTRASSFDVTILPSALDLRVQE